LEQWATFFAGEPSMSLVARIATALSYSAVASFEDERDLAQGSDTYKPAAVLIAITNRPEPGVILTQRPNWLRSHAGQVAFPGGKIDAGDENEIAAALREAEEEIALPPALVDVIGTTDEYYTGSGYRITPVIGIVPADIALTANPAEVESLFEVPLAFLLDPANMSKSNVIWQGKPRDYYEIMWQGRRIWGVTAGIIANLAKRLG
jgi:8-oxo-dGTP pyrophosphatase MutT (NUDIX family)